VDPLVFLASASQPQGLAPSTVPPHAAMDMNSMRGGSGSSFGGGSRGMSTIATMGLISYVMQQRPKPMPMQMEYRGWLGGGQERPWEDPEWRAKAVDKNRTVFILRDFLSEDEIEHVIREVVPVAGFNVTAGGKKIKSWERDTPLAGAGLAEPFWTARHQDAKNWSELSGLGEGPDEVLWRIERRITRLTGIPFHDRESPLQLSMTTPHRHENMYVGGALHHDMNVRFNRVASVIMYLNGGDDDKTDRPHNETLIRGGQTLFPCVRPMRAPPPPPKLIEAAEGTLPHGADPGAIAPPEEPVVVEEFDAHKQGWWKRAYDAYTDVLGMTKVPYQAKPLCERLEHNFAYNTFVLPHPNHVEAGEPAQKVKDANAAFEVSDMCAAESARPIGESGGDEPPDYFTMRPKRGDAVLFLASVPENGKMVPETWHMGCPVLRGTKITLQKFKEVWADGYGPEFDAMAEAEFEASAVDGAAPLRDASLDDADPLEGA
jgi:hypothetical protein